MKDYKVLQPVTIPCGLIRLNEKQSDPRMEGIKVKSKGVYEILTPQTFKAGEVIGLEDVSKALKPSMEDVYAAEVEVKKVAEVEAKKTKK